MECGIESIDVVDSYVREYWILALSFTRLK